MTMPPPLRRPAEVFSAAYDLLARAYLNGAAAFYLEATPTAGALAEVLGNFEHSLPGVLDRLLLRSETERAVAEQALESCFGLPLPGRYTPPISSVYLDGGQLWGPAAHKVMRLYEAEGLVWDRNRRGLGGAQISSPDHIGVEFAFLTVASQRAPNRGRSARITAMLAHLDAWLPLLIDALAEQASADYPHRLTTLAHSLVTADPRRTAAPEATRASEHA
jgi:hypothetical protein